MRVLKLIAIYLLFLLQIGAGPYYLKLIPKDTDGDTIPDFEDNCKQAYNPGQVDSDNNDIGDACDSQTPHITNFI